MTSAVFMMIVWGLALAQDKTNSMVTKGGIIQVNSDTNVIVVRDSILVTMIYDMNDVELMWNNYIESCESLISSIGHNKCVEKVLTDSRESRFKIKEFLRLHKTNVKNKRQAFLGIIGGLTSMVTLGLTTYELNKINEKIAEIKHNIDHNEGSIETLNKITKYNSGQINSLRNIQIHTNEILSKMKVQLLKDIDSINEIKISVVCINLKLTYMKLSSVINDIMHELRDLLEYKFDKDLITYDVKQEMCDSIESEGYKTYGVCMDFELITEINYVVLEKKIVIINKIPIRNEIDQFNLTKLITLPVKIKNNFYQAKNIVKYIALGKNFRTNLNFDQCERYKNNLFCKSSSEYRSLNESDTCVGSILSRDNKVFEVCNFEKIEIMEDYFCNVDGKYFFSINGTRVLELLCLNTLDNAQIKLTGLGSIKIKANCFAKYDMLLLTGSSTFRLNKTYQISRLLQTYVNVNFSFLSNDNIKNTSLNELNIANLETNLNYNNHYYHYHFISIYIILIFGIFILILTIVVHFKKKIYVDRTAQDKVASSNSLEENSNDLNNDIPTEALKVAKKARKSKNNSK